MRTLRYSLNTNDIKPARRLSARMGAYTWEVFGAIRRDIKEQVQPRMSAIEIRTLIKNYLDNLLHCDESIRMQAPGKALIDLYRALLADIQRQAEEATIPGAEAEIHASDEDHERLRAQGLDDDQIKRLLSPATYPAWMDWDDIARKLLEAQGCKPFREMDSAETTALTQELSKAQKQFGAIAEMRWNGQEVEADSAHTAYLNRVDKSPMLDSLNFPVVDAERQKAATAPKGPMQLRDALEALLAQTASTTDQQAFWIAVEASQRGRLSAGIASNVVETQQQPVSIEAVREDAVTPDQVINTPAAPVKRKGRQGKTLTAQIDQFIKDNKRESAWTDNTLKEVNTSLGLFLEFTGDIPFSELNEGHIRDYASFVKHHYPSNRNKKAQYKDLSNADLLKMDVPAGDLLSASRIKTCYFQWLSGFLKWTVKQRHLKEDYSPMLEFKATKKRKPRMYYTKAELEALFQSPWYMETGGESHDETFKFWIPIIALFTGARQNEIAQLEVTDILKEDGVWCFSFTDRYNAEGVKEKSVKTGSSNRLVPIHDFLLNDLNFLGFVDKLRQQGSVRLFSGLPAGPKAGDKVSKWYRTVYRKNCGIKSEKEDPNTKLTFHSFRHTFIDTVRQLGVGEEYHMAVTGHEDSSKAVHRGYGGDPRSVALKRECMDKLDYGIDLSHLKRSKWVVPAGD